MYGTVKVLRNPSAASRAHPCAGSRVCDIICNYKVPTSINMGKHLGFSLAHIE